MVKRHFISGNPENILNVSLTKFFHRGKFSDKICQVNMLRIVGGQSADSSSLLFIDKERANR
jgi:hypothetical protein